MAHSAKFESPLNERGFGFAIVEEGPYSRQRAAADQVRAAKITSAQPAAPNSQAAHPSHDEEEN